MKVAIKPATPRRRMLPVALVVIALHLALLSVPLRSVGSSNAMSVARPLSVRLLSAPEPAAALPPALPPATLEAGAQASQPMPAAAHAEPEPPPPTVAREAEPRTDAAGSVSPPVPEFGFVVPGIDSDDNYFTRSMLSLAPRPIDPVVIDYPSVAKDQGHYRSELTLFIDEHGLVVRIRVDGDELPPELEHAARNAFSKARFRAGEADGRAVKSRVRVEVEFDSRPVDRPQ